MVIIRRGMPPAIGRVEMAWRRKDVRRVRRFERKMRRVEATEAFMARILARIESWTEPGAEQPDRPVDHSSPRCGRGRR